MALIKLKTRSIPDNAVTPAKVSQNLGRRNIIINGDMKINQRAAGSLTINSGALQYPCDRFSGRGVSSAGVFTLEKVTDSPADFTNSLKATVTTADSSLSGTESYRIIQHIEGNNISYLNWGSSDNQTATLSFKVKSSLTGTFGGSVQNGDFNRFVPFSYTISSANTWEDKTVTITGDTTGTYQTNIDLAVRLNWSLGAAQLGTAGTYSGSALHGVTGQTQVISTNGATWQVTGVQLELGSAATDFEHRSFAEELAACQRYYEQTGAGAPAKANSSTEFWIGHKFSVTKRANPTASIIDPNSYVRVYEFGVADRNSDSTPTISATIANVNGATTRVGTFNGITAGNTGMLGGKDGNSGASTFAFDAEL